MTTRKKILVADKIAESGVAYLRARDNLDVDCRYGLDAAELARIIGGYHGLVVRSSTIVTADIIDAAAALQVIGRAGIGVDNINVERATERGIVVLNTPDANATTTAELTVAHILSLSRNLPQADRSMRAGEWKRAQFMGAELAGKQLGIIGYGTIGRIVAARARALLMTVAAFDPYVTGAAFEADGIASMALDELVRTSDYLTLHCPMTAKTRRIIDADRLRSMKKGARLINCARGGLVDEQALFDALQSGHLAGAALDVFETEPPAGSPLLTLEQVVVTPHLGASTHEAQEAAGQEIARQVAIFLETGEPINAINVPGVGAEELIHLRPYLRLVCKLARLLAALVEGPIRQFDVELCGDAADRDMHSISTEALIGLLSTHMSAPLNRVNARHCAEQQGIKLVEARCATHPDYHATLNLRAVHGDTSTMVEGTLFDRRHPRLIRINDYEIEAVLDGNLLLTIHKDQPGVIAAISTLLADRRINISRMQLGIVTGGSAAVAVIGVSTVLDRDLMQAIAGIPAINRVIQVAL